MAANVPLERLEECVRRLTGQSESPPIVEMPGGGSSRRFYRVTLEPDRSAVAMYVPDATRSDEIVKNDEAGRRWSFLEVRDLLQERGIRVPFVLAEACEDGFVLLEDLGDDTLAQYLSQYPAARVKLYRSAVRDLARAQRALADLPRRSIIASRALDEDLLAWEMDHFREWGLEARDIRLSDRDRRTFDEASSHIARLVASWPRGFVHRDYQSRNLMVREVNGEPELVWIDFQDALLGPRVYDLVALLNDSYQVFERPFIEERLDEYAHELGLDAEHRQALGREFDVVTIQRKLKDAGRFVYFDRVKNNPNFLRFVEPTIQKARLALARVEHDAKLRALAELLDRLL
ncbi:MAG TPA: phosphotransferase [Polyangiaceae bacterium]|nr:phosphotransferase [Polyangiaceae bacterium]